MPYEMLTSLTSRLYLSWELFTQGILILVPGSFFQLPLPLLFSRVDRSWRLDALHAFITYLRGIMGAPSVAGLDIYGR